MTKTFFQDDEKVVINGREFDLELFLTLDPNYQYNRGWKRDYIQNVKHSYGNGSCQLSGPLNWNLGNKYCTRVNDLIYLKQYLNSEMTS
jgi:hypothetical protein